MINKLFEKNAQMVKNRPKIVLLVALIITLIAGVLATSLKMDLNWVALAPKGNPAVKEYQEIIEDFPTLNSIIVLIESDNREKLVEVSKELTEKVGNLKEYVMSVASGVEREFMLEKGMMYLPKEEIQMMEYVFTAPNINSLYELMYLNMSDVINKIEKKQISNEEIQHSVAAFDSMKSILFSTNKSIKENIDEIKINENLEKLFVGSEILTSPDGKMTMLTIQPNFDIMDMDKIIVGVNTIENEIKKIDEKYNDVKVKATGMHIVARDETKSIESDSYFTTVLSLLMILSILYFAFRSLLAPLFSFIPLMLGIIWSMGLAGLTVGRLNMMTVFSAAMLLGLGIDYAIHMYSSYTERRSYGEDKKTAIEYAITKTGPSIVVGGLTTAIAFISLNVSSLEILSELGTIMGAGIITTLISVFWVLPSMIMLKKEKEVKIKKIKGNYPFIGAIAKNIYNNKKVISIGVVILSILVGMNASNISFDMNLMNLEPEGLESIEIMNYMVEKYDTSADSFAVQVNSLEEVYKLHEAFEKIENVSEVISIASVIPKKELQLNRLKAIEKTKKNIESSKMYLPADINILEETLNKMSKEFDRYQKVWGNSNIEIISDLEFKEAKSHINDLKQSLESNYEEERIQQLSKHIYDSMSDIGEKMLSTTEIKVEELPSAYKSQFVSSDGEKYMILVYPSFDIWSNLGTQKGEKFLEDLKSVEKTITGTPIFMKALYDAAASEVTTTGIILFVVLFAILRIHFKSTKYAVLAFLPLIFTLIFMVGTMAILNIDFNMLNFLAILLVIGIGLDDGVHVLHHYKEGERDIRKLFSSIGRAILITTITTVCGFGSLAFSSYRGIASLGTVLTIGVIYAFLFTVLILPIFLKEEIMD